MNLRQNVENYMKKKLTPDFTPVHGPAVLTEVSHGFSWLSEQIL
jgi:hypothetical protein